MKVIIFLQSLAAEGCPQLALGLAKAWREEGIEAIIVTLERGPLDLAVEFKRLGVTIVLGDYLGGSHRHFRLARATHAMCRQWKPAAVLSFPLGWHAPIAWGAKAAGVRRVCAHVGNLPPIWSGRSFQKFRLLVTAGRPVTDRLLCCSEYIRHAAVRDFRLAPYEAKSIYNGCDDRFFSAESPRDFTRPIPRILMVARLEPHKDQPTLIRAAALLQDRGTPIEVWLAGEGTERDSLTDLSTGLGLGPRVRLLGARRDIPRLLQRADLFVFAAKPDEGFGIALAEAMAVGVPIVATDVGACREVLDQGRCGLLVEAGNPQALADGIWQCLQDPNSCSARVAEGRSRAQQFFTMREMSNEYAFQLGLIP